MKSTNVSRARNTIRTTEHIPVLIRVSVLMLTHGSMADATYKKPSPMRKQTPILMCLLIWIFHSKTIGSRARAKSQNRDAAALYISSSESPRVFEDLPPWNKPISIWTFRSQHVPGVSGFQSFCKGEHWAGIVVKAARFSATLIKMMGYKAHLAAFFVANKR